MPELPEVETMRRGVLAAVGCRIRGVRRPASALEAITMTPPPAEFRRRAAGRRIIAVARAGKRIVLELDNADRIVLEPRMTGLVLLGDPPERKHLRLVFQLAGGAAKQLLFWDQRGLGVVRLVSPAEYQERYGPEKLGPDALQISPVELRARLTGSRRAIKVALLDQRALAGVGNLYASEILHHAGIHPQLPCCRLSRRQWAKLHGAMLRVLEEAIRHQGSTLRDGTYRIARNEPGSYQLLHLVYQRAGELCGRCGQARIQRMVQAQRSTFFCPLCQRRA
ncbi:MAG: bifunctional DNA-formamidopyrimidine glycosylase/DNA-(apurinic or apyrimidinic site) lyase, partial [Thermoguttaceae bacterium]